MWERLSMIKNPETTRKNTDRSDYTKLTYLHQNNNKWNPEGNNIRYDTYSQYI